MGACATKPKTLEGQAPAEATISTPKVAPETTTIPIEVAAEQVVEKVVEENKEEEPAVVVEQKPPATAEPEQTVDEVITPEAVKHKDEEEEEEALEKIVVEEEKPSAAHAEEKIATGEVTAEPTTEVKKDAVGEEKETEMEKEKPMQS